MVDELGIESPAAKTLVSEGAVYALVEVAQQGLALLSLPVFFFLLTPEDFGLITIALVLTQVALTLSTFGLDFSVMRLYFTWPPEERGSTLAGITLVSTLWCAVLAVGLHAALRLAGVGATAYWAMSAGWWGGLALGLRGVPLAVVRVKGAMRQYALFVLGGAVAQVVLQMALVAGRLGPGGYMIGYALGAAASAVVALAAIRQEYDWSGRVWKLPRDTVVFTARVLPSVLLARAVAISDRLVLSRWSSQEILGVYGAASRFTTPIKFLSGGFKLALAPLMSREERSGNLDVEFARLSRFLVLGMLLIGALVAAGTWLVQLTPWADASEDMQRLVGLLLIAQFLSGLMFLGQVRLYYSPRPGSASIVAGVNAAALFGCLAWLVPRSGAVGAAGAAALSGAAGLGTVIVLAFFATRRWREWYQLVALIGTFLPCLAATWFLHAPGQLAVFLLSATLYAVALFVSLRHLRRGQALQGTFDR